MLCIIIVLYNNIIYLLISHITTCLYQTMQNKCFCLIDSKVCIVYICARVCVCVCVSVCVCIYYLYIYYSIYISKLHNSSSHSGRAWAVVACFADVLHRNSHDKFSIKLRTKFAHQFRKSQKRSRSYH